MNRRRGSVIGEMAAFISGHSWREDARMVTQGQIAKRPVIRTLALLCFLTGGCAMGWNARIGKASNTEVSCSNGKYPSREAGIKPNHMVCCSDLITYKGYSLNGSTMSQDHVDCEDFGFDEHGILESYRTFQEYADPVITPR